MHRYLIAVTALAAALALPLTATAKGPESAAVSGPQLGRALAVTGDGEGGNGSALGSLVDLGGFFPQMYGQAPTRTLKQQPRGALGPRYQIAYVVPGPNGIKSTVVQLVYPYAKPVPLTYMQPSQRYWGGRLTVGGWFRASPELRQALVRFGLPKTAPAASHSAATMSVVGGTLGGVVLVAATGWLWFRRRPTA